MKKIKISIFVLGVAFITLFSSNVNMINMAKHSNNKTVILLADDDLVYPGPLSIIKNTNI